VGIEWFPLQGYQAAEKLNLVIPFTASRSTLRVEEFLFSRV
jgi:hypothetical protein